MKMKTNKKTNIARITTSLLVMASSSLSLASTDCLPRQHNIDHLSISVNENNARVRARFRNSEIPNGKYITLSSDIENSNSLEMASLIPLGIEKKIQTNFDVKTVSSPTYITCATVIKNDSENNNVQTKPSQGYFKVSNNLIWLRAPEFIYSRERFYGPDKTRGLFLSLRVIHTVTNDSVYPGIPVRNIRYFRITLKDSKAVLLKNLFHMLTINKSNIGSYWTDVLNKSTQEGAVTVFHKDIEGGKVISSVARVVYHNVDLKYSDAYKFRD